MELINEYRSLVFTAFISSLNQMKVMSEVGVTKQQWASIFSLNAGLDEEDHESKAFLSTFSNAYFNLTALIEQISTKYKDNQPIQPGLSIHERAYLKAILQHPYSRLFFDDEEIALINGALENISSLPIAEHIEIREMQPMEELSEDFIRNFRLIRKAIHLKKKIRYTNTTKSGQIYEGQIAIPMYIEFSVIENRFRISMWNIEQQRPFKANLSSLSDVAIADNTDVSMKPISELMKTKLAPSPLILEISHERNALERSLLLFASYDKKVTTIDEKHTEMEIHYYTFDEQELFQSVLSLGPRARIVSPQHMIDILVDTLKQTPKSE